jgi:hypothetical protein
VRVYFDAERRLYFFMADGRWCSAAQLPADLDLGDCRFVMLSLEASDPYAHFCGHKPKRPPGQAKGKGRTRGKSFSAAM